MAVTRRNAICPCGSGKRSKHCCSHQNHALSANDLADQSSTEMLEEGIRHHRAGSWQTAEAIYLQILRDDSMHAGALHLLGLLAHQFGDYSRAIDCMHKAIQSDSTNPLYYCNLGNAFKELGRHDMAIANYQQALSLEPRFFLAQFNIGAVQLGQSDLDAAIGSFKRAIALDPENAEAAYALGLAQDRCGQHEDAALSFHMSIKLNPLFAEAHFQLGLVLYRQRRYAEAGASYRKAIDIKPNHVEAYSNLGFALIDMGDTDSAIQAYRSAVEIEPQNAEILNNLAMALERQGRHREAVDCFTRALTIRPDLIEAHFNCGCTFWVLGEFERAAVSLSRALQLSPQYLDAHVHLGNVLNDQCKQEAAAESYLRALAIEPDHSEARWAWVMNLLPKVYGTNQDPRTCREVFAKHLAELDAWFTADRIGDEFNGIGTSPFYLAYQEEDNRPLLSHYGTLCCRLMRHWQQQHIPTTVIQNPVGRIRVGIVSSHFRDHSVWHALIRGWLKHLDRSRFDLHLFYLGNGSDAQTEEAKSLVCSFSEGGRAFSVWVDTILEKQLEVLIYPEIGMDPTTTRLACLRLAPVQMVAWGHPDTSGLPTMDYYLSAKDFEPDGAGAHYTEDLIELPNMGCCYSSLSPQYTVPYIENFGLEKSTVPLLLCPGTPFKFNPKNDWLFPRIAQRVGRCKFVFFTQPNPAMSDRLQNRLRASFSMAGVDFEEHVVFIPWQTREDFFGLMRVSSLCLDSIGFSGFNTAMQAIECGLPIVTVEGRFMRGRFASGILKRIGLHSLVTRTPDEYLERVVRLIEDGAYRNAVVNHIVQFRQQLFDDLAPIIALEARITKLARRVSDAA